MAMLRNRKQSYQRTFNKESQDALAVLGDLSKFCRAEETTYLPDQRASDVLTGRREVWLRINEYLQLSDDELFAIRAKMKPEQGEQQ